MSNRYPIDDFFRRRLEDYSTEAPMHLWDRIEQQRRDQRGAKRRRLLLYSLGLITALGLYGSLHLLSHSGPEVALSAFPIPHATPATVDDPLAPAFAVTTEPSPSVTPTEPANLRRQSAVTVNKPTISLTATSTSTPSTRIAIAKTGLPAEEQSAIFVSPPPTAIAPIDAVDEITDKAVTVISGLEENRETAAPFTDDKYASRISGPHLRTRPYEAPMEKLPSKLTYLKSKATWQPPINTLRCARLGTRQPVRLNVEALAGPAYAHQRLAARQPESRSHLEQRQATETPTLSFSSSLRLAASLPNGITFRGGLAYTQTNDRFQYLNKTEIRSITQRLDEQGRVIGVDTSYMTEIIHHRSRNYQRFLELPLLAGYEFRWNRLRVGISGGVFLNLNFTARGDFLAPGNGLPTPYGQVGDAGPLPVFQRRAGSAWYISASALYYLGNGFSLIAEPFFKEYPQSLTQPQYPLRQTNWSTGLLLGLRRQL